ncbi:MAG TPA: UDP-glucose/GDP-mannose dehydrogenase family protein [Thermomicrobiales bacterium]|nr:UDP-glucose/GDP-mannose dehydrogenase family protein [Thermomicrobiales bacterium]
MDVTIFGSGYVGLVTGACFAEVGNDVVLVDIDQERVARLNRGEVPIFEPGLGDMIARNRRAGRISFTTDPEAGVDHGEFVIIAVGTPPQEDGSSDLRAVQSVARSIGQFIDTPKIIINKSTVPVGTADLVRSLIDEVLAEREVTVPFEVVSNPEFLKEGAAIDDFMKPDRIIVGSNNHQATELMRDLYAPFNRNHGRMLVMDVRSAEFTKYAANAMLATKISFMNELAGIAERVGVDIENVRVGIGSDPRIGYSFIYPGCGYGGSCFPKDIRSLERTAAAAGYDAELLRSVESVNERQKRVLFTKISDHFDGDLTGRRIALWGLSFKPNTDDMRDAPSRPLIESLWDAGAIVQAFDPEAMDEAQRHYPDQVAGDQFVLCETAEAALHEADALVIVTEWRAFRSPDFEALRASLKQPVIFDGRNIYDPARMRKEGFIHYGIGLGSKQAPAAAGQVELTSLGLA